MTTIQFLTEWALRSSALILGGMLLLWALRVKDPSIRLAAWTAMLGVSLALPALNASLPKAPVALARKAAHWQAAPAAAVAALPAVAPGPGSGAETHAATARPGFNWTEAALALYAAVAFAMLLRVGVGLAMTLRLLRRSRATGQSSEGIEIRESDGVGVPVALGIVRPAIVLPLDWRGWDGAKLGAVLAHERSHIRRRDPAVQALSAIHRALLWHSPLSWFLHTRIVRAAEEASDDAAVVFTRDRGLYAEVVLEFVQRSVRPRSVAGVNWMAAPMARYGSPDKRIHRILDSVRLSRGITRANLAAILAFGAPLAYLAAAASPQNAPQAPAAAGQPKPALVQFPPQPAAAPSARPLRGEKKQGSPQPNRNYVTGPGQVAPSSTVTIKPRVDGELLSVSFKEGEMVEAGQLLATIDPRPFEPAIAQAEAMMAQDGAVLNSAVADVERYRKATALGENRQDQPADANARVAQLKGRLQADRVSLDQAKLPMSYTKIASPISGLAGLRLVDPGNVVRASDAGGIVVITQLQPIAVLFDIPEDVLPEVRARLRDGGNPPVEAWSRDDTVKLATGRLTAVDNQIDATSGTAKLKAVFDNKDDALFPGQFVNVRMPLGAR